MVSERRLSTKQRVARSNQRFWLLGIAGLLFCLLGCRSPEVDTRPAWVQEAEARLQRPPSWKVTGTGMGDEAGAANTSRPSGFVPSGSGQSSFFGAGERVTASDSSRSRGQPTTTGVRQPTSVPEGVHWGETRITVTVED